MSRPSRPPSRSGRAATPPPGRRAPRATAAPLVPLPHALRMALIVIAAGLAIALVSYPFYDPDLWQHLRVGRALWEGLGFPTVNVWTWPTHGAPDLVPSWLFRALLWPFWKVGEVPGLFVWRWLTTLLAFGFVLAAARAGHPRDARFAPTGGAALIALVWCVMVYRYRSQARPETLVAVLLAAELWVLESWRARGGGRLAWALPAIAALWANTHVSYYVGLFITGTYLLDALARRWRRQSGPPPRELALALLASGLASFLNPYGWKFLAQPFEYFLVWRHEPIFRSIGELRGPDWEAYAPVGLPLFLALMVVLALLRLRRRGPDLAQLAILGLLVPQSLGSQRFLGYLAIAGAPFFARDLTWALGSLPRPAWLARPGARAAAGAALLALITVPALTTDPLRPTMGVRWNMYPVRASDYVEREGIRGRAFNQFQQGGYLLWRFWPDSTRLPFMDIHQTGTREDRRLYAFSQITEKAWRELDRRHRFDWALISRLEQERSPLLDFLDADTTTWSLVFVDDAAALFLRRNGADAAAAERDRYRWVPAGEARLRIVGPLVYADPAVKAAVRTELERSAASSPWNSDALSPLINIALSDARWTDALDLLERARKVAPHLARLEERRGLALLATGHAAEALDAFDRQSRREPSWKEAGLRRGNALRALGRSSEAVAAYRQAVRDNPANAEARDSLASIQAGGR